MTKKQFEDWALRVIEGGNLANAAEEARLLYELGRRNERGRILRMLEGPSHLEHIRQSIRDSK